MNSTAGALRRRLYAAFTVSAVGGVALAAPSATAAPDPCTASQVAKTVGTVATNTSNYLDLHPETDQAFTAIAQLQAGPQSLGVLKAYLDANPQVGKDMQQLQQPLIDLSGQCQLPVSIPQLLGLVQAAQSQPGIPPGGLARPQAVSVPGVVVPPQRSAVSAVTQGAGPLGGPVIAATG